MQINKITPRFFYTHPYRHTPPFPRNATHIHTHTEYLGPASPVAWQQLMGKKAGGAPMIKISWVAAFDPQYAVIVSPQLHKRPDTGAAREGREYINFLTPVRRWLALLTDFSSNFLRIKKPPNPPTNPPPSPTRVNSGLSLLPLPTSCHTSHFDNSPVSHVFQREAKKKRKYIN